MTKVSGWITAREAASRLGVKPATLYAYVSRRVLSRHRSPSGQSLFDPAEIERLARRGRPRRTPSAAELVIESRVTALGSDRPRYRGRDALELAASSTFESVAEWLWAGDPSALQRPPAAWQATEFAVAAGRAAQSGLPAEALPLERLQVIVPALASADPLRNNLDPSAVIDIGRGLIAGMVACLPGSTSDGDIADRLWAKLSPVPPMPALVAALRSALILVADHELAASTLAARVAASVRADPYGAVIAGLAASGGSLHGGASLGAEKLLAEAERPDRVRELIGLRLRSGERVPGFGHLVYRPTDARATALLDHVRAAAASSPPLDIAEAFIVEARRRRIPEPNVEFALALLSRVAGMPTGSAEAIFAIARTAGWLAHAIEEYENPTRLRLRAVYIGPQ